MFRSIPAQRIGVLSFNDENKYCRVVDLSAISFNFPTRRRDVLTIISDTANKPRACTHFRRIGRPRRPTIACVVLKSRGALNGYVYIIFVNYFVLSFASTVHGHVRRQEEKQGTPTA